jgi:hypothetical protein
MEEVPNKSASNLGVAALITAIITFVLAVIPCVGLIAFIPGIIAIILATVGLSQASRGNSPKGVLIAGLIIGVIAFLISISQFYVGIRLARGVDKLPGEFGNIIKDVQENVIREMDENDISIKIQSGGDSIVIKSGEGKKEREETLESLEKDAAKAKADSLAGKK